MNPNAISDLFDKIYVNKADFRNTDKLRSKTMKLKILKTFILLTIFFYAPASFAAEMETIAESGKIILNPDFSRQKISHIEVPAPAKSAADFSQTGPENAFDLENPIENFGNVGEWMYRGARLPDDIHYEFLRDLGITTVIDMQWPLKDDQNLCEKYGLNCIYNPVILIPEIDLYFDMKALKKAFKKTVEEFKAGKMIYIHCHFGSDRTGILASAFIIKQNMCHTQNPNDPLLQEKTMKSVEADLLKHGYNETYQKPLKEMKTWITEFDKNKDWLCQ